MIFEEQFPVPRYTAASKIGNSVISLLWKLRCRCNTDHNKFSSLSNTTMVAIFPKLCFWRRSLCSNLRGIDPEKLYRATLIISRLLPFQGCASNDIKGLYEPITLNLCFSACRTKLNYVYWTNVKVWKLWFRAFTRQIATITLWNFISSDKFRSVKTLPWNL